VKKKEVFIISAIRTPLGSFGGVFSNLSATKLGSEAIIGVLKKSNLNPKNINEVFMGNVCSADLGQAPARQAALGAGIPDTVPCTTINKVCSSGAKSIMLGSQSILLGQSDIVIAGGMENMSRIPYYIPKARYGYKYGNSELIDGLHKDGLLDPFSELSMGVFADKTAEKYNISRQQQDEFAIRSYKNSAHSNNSGIFANELIEVSITQKNGEQLLINKDEEYKNVNFEKIPKLKAAFSKNGTVTAANSSTMNDGASALILASAEAIKKHNLSPIAKILSFADSAHAPEWFTTAPTKAAPKALKIAKMTTDDVDYF